MTLSPRQLTMVHRRQQLALRSVVLRDIASVWPQLDYSHLEQTFPTFAASALATVSKRRGTSSGLSIAYLRAFRVASGLNGNVKIVRPPMTRSEFVNALRATSLAPIKNATANGKAPNQTMTDALVLAAGAMSRLVLNAGRETITQTVAADPAGQGFVRVLGGQGCDYCQGLAGLHINTSEVFESHGNCGCTAEPVFG